MPEPVSIHAGNAKDFLDSIRDEGRSRGLIPRNYATHPPGYQAVAPVFDPAILIPENEWASRLKDQQDAKASLFDLRESNYNILKSLDQNGIGICWCFSTTKSVMYLRAKMNEPGVILSPWWVAGKIVDWADQGGFGAQSLEFIAKNGVPAMSLCPEYRSKYDTADTRADAQKHKVTAWSDGTNDRNMNKKIMISAFLMGMSPVLDYDWLSHSLAGCRLVSIDPVIVDCDNSWGDTGQYGEKGLYRMEGSHAIPDGIVVPMITDASI